MWALWSIIGASTAFGASFNTSVWLEVGGLSPICQLPGAFSYNESSGLLDRTWFGRPIWLSSNFVGTAFNITGSLQYTPGATELQKSTPLASTRLGDDPPSNVTFQENASIDALIASMSGLNLSNNVVGTEIGFRVNCSYNKFQFEVPVLTQAYVSCRVIADD